MIPRFKFFALICISLAVTTLVSAQTITFQPLNGPNGVQDIGKVDTDNSGHLFMLKSNIIYSSTDNGNSWTECMNGIVSTFNFYFKKFLHAPSGAFYLQTAYSNTALYKYIQISNTWAPVQLPFDGYLISSLDIDTQNRIWVSTNQNHPEIHYSIDGGATFQQITLEEPIEGWVEGLFTFNGEHNLIAINTPFSQKAFHFNIEGNVQEIFSGSSIEYLGYNHHSGTAYLSSFNQLKRSSNGGLTWQGVTIVPGFPYQSVSRMSFDTSGTTWIHLDNGTYRSDDDGLSWTKDELLSAFRGKFYLLTCGWFITNGCEYPNFGRSTDSGNSWTDLARQFREPYIRQIKVDAAEVLYARTCRRDAYEKSVDNGQNWSDLVIMDSVTIYLQNLATRPDGVMMAVSKTDRLYRSLNNGATWEQIINIPLQLNDPNYCGFFTDLQGAFYFFNLYDQVVKSMDNGNSWQSINLWSTSLESIAAIHPNGDIYLADYSNSAIYVASADSTRQLEFNNQPLAVRSIHCTTNGITYLTEAPIFNGSGLFRILPDGNYLPEPIPFFNVNSNISAIASNAEGNVFVVNGNTIYKSVDDGITWQNVGVVPQIGYLNTLYVAPDQYMYAGFSGDVIYRSTAPTSGIFSPIPITSAFSVITSPNPFEHSITFTINSPELSKNLIIRLFDVQGRLVRQEEFATEKFALLRNELENGLYYFLIESDGNRIGAGKILAQ